MGRPSGSQYFNARRLCLDADLEMYAWLAVHLRVACHPLLTLRGKRERRVVDQTGIEPVTS